MIRIARTTPDQTVRCRSGNSDRIAPLALGRNGRSRQARRNKKLVAVMYGWFTDGFDTADLKEPKALLEAFL
jgi:hypothetical protein